jgi:hypothetical protein
LGYRSQDPTDEGGFGKKLTSSALTKLASAARSRFSLTQARVDVS